MVLESEEGIFIRIPTCEVQGKMKCLMRYPEWVMGQSKRLIRQFQANEENMFFGFLINDYLNLYRHFL